MPEYGSTIRVAMPRPPLAGRAAGAGDGEGEGEGEGEGDAVGEGEGDGDGVKLGKTLGASPTARKSPGSRSGVSDGGAVPAGVATVVGVASARAITGAVYESRPETTSMTPPRAISVERKRANERCDGGMAVQHHARGAPPRPVTRPIGLQTRAGSFSRSGTAGCCRLLLARHAVAIVRDLLRVVPGLGLRLVCGHRRRRGHCRG